MRIAWVAWGRVQASDGGCLQAADLHAVVAAVVGVVGDGDLAPGQGGQLVQGTRVGPDEQDVGGVLQADQPVGVLALGVQRVGGHHLSGKVQLGAGRNWASAGQRPPDDRRADQPPGDPTPRGGHEPPSV